MTAPLIHTDDMFNSVEQYGATLNALERERIAADYIDNTERRRVELAAIDAQIDIAHRTPIRHDGSDRCPAFPGRSIFVIHRLNGVILRAPYPERLLWSDIIGWNFERNK